MEVRKEMVNMGRVGTWGEYDQNTMMYLPENVGQREGGVKTLEDLPASCQGRLPQPPLSLHPVVSG